MLTFLILIRLGCVGKVHNDIKNLFKNQEIEQKSITDRKFKLTLHVIFFLSAFNALSTNKISSTLKNGSDRFIDSGMDSCCASIGTLFFKCLNPLA